MWICNELQNFGFPTSSQILCLCLYAAGCHASSDQDHVDRTSTLSATHIKKLKN
ncbi:hypothetical protein MKX03_035038, partial [Papaver bracteatum]